MAFISVVIPNYNSSRTIAKTIISLKNQSFRDFYAGSGISQTSTRLRGRKFIALNL